MATTKKKTPASQGGARAASKEKSTKSTKPKKSAPKSAKSIKSVANRQRGGARVKQPEARPVRREVGALVCLLLSLFAALGYFRIDAIFINFLCGAVKGLLGYGFWFFPPALLGASLILAFHRGRPVKLRIWCVMLMPVLLGSFLHMFLFQEPFVWSFASVQELWISGETLQSGGALSGLLSQILVAVFSKIGASLIFAVLSLGMLMVIFRVGPEDIVDWIRDRPRREYDEDDFSQPEPRKHARPALPDRRNHRRPIIDIDGPVWPEDLEEPEPEPEPKKRGFFDRIPKVPAPDQMLGRIMGDDTAPIPEPVPEVASKTDIPAAAVPPQPEPDLFPPISHLHQKPVMSEPILTQPQPGTLPVPPVAPMDDGKLKKGEAAQAAAEVGQAAEAAMARAASAYQYPPVSLLSQIEAPDANGVTGELKVNQQRLTDTIHSFGIEANIVNVTRGPSVTRYELELDQGVRLNKLTNLSDDIALSLGASGVRIAPIPNQISMVGIEVPNKLVTPVSIHEVIDSKAFREHSSKVCFALGKDIGGSCIVGNIAKLPHLLIAGTTGSGKSVCTNSLIISLLYKASPEEVRLIMVDPKMVELGIYNGIPHLLIPVVTDPKKAAGALQWAVTEMMKRYRAFSEAGVRDLASYNRWVAKQKLADPKKAEEQKLNKMPQVVVVIDELADLMLVAAKEVEESICRVAQMGRAAGMHLIIATQRPSADVITGLMKANIPSRIAFAVASSLESRIILDQTGAEKLVGRGDMLYFPLGAGKPTRVQGCLINDDEVARVVEFVKASGDTQYDENVLHEIEQNVAGNEKGSKGAGGSAADAVSNDYDEMLPNAIEVVVDTGMASVSMLQRRLKLGYSRAARLVDQM